MRSVYIYIEWKKRKQLSSPLIPAKGLKIVFSSFIEKFIDCAITEV